MPQTLLSLMVYQMVFLRYLVVEPFCGSGSTLIASTKLGRRCNIMEKQPIYAEVALARWEKETGLKRQLVSRADQDAQNAESR